MKTNPSGDVLVAIAEWKQADSKLRRACIAFFQELNSRRFQDRTDTAIEAIRQHIVEERDRTPAAIHDAAATILDEREQRCRTVQ